MGENPNNSEKIFTAAEWVEFGFAIDALKKETGIEIIPEKLVKFAEDKGVREDVLKLAYHIFQIIAEIAHRIAQSTPVISIPNTISEKLEPINESGNPAPAFTQSDDETLFDPLDDEFIYLAHEFIKSL